MSLPKKLTVLVCVASCCSEFNVPMEVTGGDLQAAMLENPVIGELLDQAREKGRTNITQVLAKVEVSTTASSMGVNKALVAELVLQLDVAYMCSVKQPTLQLCSWYDPGPVIHDSTEGGVRVAPAATCVLHESAERLRQASHLHCWM